MQRQDHALFFLSRLISIFLVLIALLAVPAIAQDAETEEETNDEEMSESLDEITVSASYSLNRVDPVDRLPFSKEDIDRLPTFADDLYRAVALLPGTSGSDLSARFSVRGGPYEDVLVRLDGVEIFEPFHLKDFSGVFTILDPAAVDAVDLLPGAFPARYGDRKAAVLDMTTKTPTVQSTRIGGSLSTATISRGGLIGEDGRSSYFAGLRRGWLDVVLDIVGDDEEEGEQEGAPEYWDFFGKVDRRFGERGSGVLWALWAADQLQEEELEDGAVEKSDNSYGNEWLSANYQHLINDRSYVSTRAFLGRVDRERDVSESESETSFAVLDDRDLEIYGLAQEWSFDLGERHVLDAGFEARSYSATYDYALQRAFTDPISGVGNSSTDVLFADDVDGESYSLWISDRFRLHPRLVAEVGLRWDRQTWLAENLDDDQLDPRLNLVWDLGSAGMLRAGWGNASQSQRPNELMVEDDDFDFYEAERAEHRTLGWDRPFADGSRLRIDLFQRLTDNPRPRYINLFNAQITSPEGSPDRVRWAPEESRAQGVELFYQPRRGERLNGWVSYAWSEVEDRVDGAWVSRNIDQTHALTANLSYRLGKRWNFDLVWLYHTGRPITGVTAQLQDGAVVPQLGPLFEERLEDYHRLDLRASRSFRLQDSELELYIDVQNLYNRENERGWEFGESAFNVSPDGTVAVAPEVDTWLGIVPSFGLTWSF